MGARHFGIGWESTWGTEVAPTIFLEATRESIRNVPSFVRTETMRTFSSRRVDAAFNFAEGDFEGPLEAERAGHLFLWLFGSTSVSGSGTYTHTFPHGTTGIAATARTGISTTVEVRRDDALCWRYPGAKLTGLGITASTDDIARFRASILAKAGTAGETPASSSYASSFLPFRPSQISVTFDGTALDARSMSLNLAWPVDQPQILGQSTLGIEPMEDASITATGSVEVYYTSDTQYAKFAAFTDVDVAITCTASASSSVTFNLNKVRLTQATPNVDARRRLMATYEFESFFDATATENCQVVVVNSVADLTP